MNAPLAITNTTPCTDNSGQTCKLEQLKLNQIPDAMDKMGWTVSAKMMRHWFSIKPAWEMPDNIKANKINPLTLTASQYNDTILTMKWAMGFERVNKALNELYDKWASPEGIKRVRQRLENAGWKETNSAPFSLGYGQTQARVLNQLCQVNVKGVGALTDTLDDFYGAVGKAVLHIAVVGTATGTTFTVEKLGAYLRDTYDFKGWQPLGVWSKNRCLNKIETADYHTPPLSLPDLARKMLKYKGFVSVENADFRRWQQVNNEGGDFVAYSDVYWMQPNVTTLILPT